jgi:hypothetical protein
MQSEEHAGSSDDQTLAHVITFHALSHATAGRVGVENHWQAALRFRCELLRRIRLNPGYAAIVGAAFQRAVHGISIEMATRKTGDGMAGGCADHPDGLHVSIETPPAPIDITRCRCTRRICNVVKRQEP